jgi:hypothetical protein
MVKYPKIIFKLDAEGCEYKIISKLKTLKNLASLRKIFIEYHFGPKDIPMTLTDWGFDITIEIKEDAMGLINGTRVDNR